MASGDSGIWFHVLPSSVRPFFFLLTPPHCLKKNGTPAARHWSRMSVAHSACMGLAPGPDSPPTMTQSMPSKSISGMGPSSGSKDKNFIAAGVCLRCSIRNRQSVFSTVTPVHTFCGHGSSPLNWSRRCDRLVNT